MTAVPRFQNPAAPPPTIHDTHTCGGRWEPEGLACATCAEDDLVFGALLRPWLRLAESDEALFALASGQLDGRGMTRLVWWTACVFSRALGAPATVDRARWAAALPGARGAVLLDGVEAALGATHEGDDPRCGEELDRLHAVSVTEDEWRAVHRVFAAIGHDALMAATSPEQRAAYFALLSASSGTREGGPAMRRRIAVGLPEETLNIAMIAGAYENNDSVGGHGLLTKLAMRGDLSTGLFLLAWGAARYIQDPGSLRLLIVHQDGGIEPVGDYRSVADFAQVTDQRQLAGMLTIRLVDELRVLPDDDDGNAAFGRFQDDCGDNEERLGVVAFGAVFNLAAVFGAYAVEWARQEGTLW